jgi:hypothetical protein
MSNEITVRAGVSVKSNVNYRPAITGFSVNQNVVSGIGEVPGGVIATTAGVDITFTGLILPGWCEIENQDLVNRNVLVWGIKDQTTGAFYPIGDLWVGEKCVFRISQFINQEITGTGTHAGADAVRIHLKALKAAIPAAVRAFET